MTHGKVEVRFTHLLSFHVSTVTALSSISYHSQQFAQDVFGHQRWHGVPNQIVKVRALVDERQIKEIREGLHPRCLVRRQHPGLKRVGEPPSTVATKASGQSG